ncbi:MAG: hypothetical protein EAZ32_19460 [Cytophagia bacterium]|nr:MAG: hypothetical protein EAZ46_12475 [Runella sp.]TAG23982.1 MAG: hypothetical protein EAZ38_02120 [Cytophagales bacterium]TAG34670.1 MAG: hypothetical protein EAZ32_19460 [Cytophagia bacterium]TAG53459.1 MAG: hypothetical protein EAZ29_05630 [Runella slithyformis]TAG76714.1 MAG: hypothetical protein EAZ22_17330 [Cytophagales bacterium]
MKKLLIFCCLLAALSCRKNDVLDPAQACDKELEQYEAAIELWSKDITNKAKCEAVKKSLTNIIRNCSLYTAAQRKVYEEQLKDSTCD